MSQSSIVRNNPKKVYSDSVEYGGLVFLRGVIANDRSKGVAEQTKQVLQTIDELLADSGSSKAEILSATIYMVDISQREVMNEVWSAWIDAGKAPARATVGVIALGTSDCLIEISVIAAK